MNRRRFLLRRGLFALVAAYAVLTAAFLFIELSPDPNLSVRLWFALTSRTGPPVEEVRQTYIATHGGSAPPLVKYGRWLWRVTTLQWGRSFSTNQPVIEMLVTHLRVTALYLVPAMIGSVLVGVGYGVYSALHPESLLDKLGTAATYLGFGLPNVFLAVALPVALEALGVIPDGFEPPRSPSAYSSITPDLLLRLVIPAFVLSTTLVAGIAHYTRSETADRLSEEFVKLVRAKGASTRRIGRHALRNGALQLIALVFSEFLAVLALHVFIIETVFSIPGFGTLLFDAIRRRDVPVVMGATFVVVFAGILGNFLQDVLAASLDPRLDD